MSVPLNEEMKEWLSILSTNKTREKTDADIAFEIEKWGTIFQELRKNGIESISVGVNENGEEITKKIKGEKTRTFIADAIGLSPAQVGKFEKVNHQGSEELKESLMNGNIPVHLASEVASLTKEKQKKFIKETKERKKDNKIEKEDFNLYKKNEEEDTLVLPESEMNIEKQNESNIISEAAESHNKKYLINKKKFEEDIKAVKDLIVGDVILPPNEYNSYEQTIRFLQKIFINK